ncbi:vanadium-dependent haloperoxidase [Echinicola rosea]|uniref:Haloperoxidase n=1 Tax=Echinicola rosea TaxID=1807691 RepID=A0ABQ1V4H6_9BACT|nr:vanadium-dependent haloperoxidase [Echinicola rosea]GGF36206.1 hypothetical protein GCM10011339_25880 [Echinicola rosea]
MRFNFPKGILYIIMVLTTVTNISKAQEYRIKQHRGNENIAYKWAELSLEATARDTDNFKPRPTITSRYLALVFTAVFDAWSRYDTKAVPVYLDSVQRRPVTEQTLDNKKVAISYAAFRTLSEYYYSDTVLFRSFMKEIGLDPNDRRQDPSTPVGIGNLAAQAVIDARRGDGANQYGEETGPNGQPYFDYTGYKPANSADQSNDVERWQPKYFLDLNGDKFAPGCLTPYWYLVKPISLESADQFRPGPPPSLDSPQLLREVREVVSLQADLTDENKALVEFMRDGPQSVQQAGHWLNFSQQVSKRDQHTLDEDVKMYFYVQMVAMDAFIACWDSKMYYDFARPIALVHKYFGGKLIKAWAGPNKGMVMMDGSKWRPYSPETFLCPPFPSYVSGHSSISGGCAEALKLWTGSDDFGVSVELVAGAMTEPKHLGDTVCLDFPTFTKTAEMAGISRVMGGYHIQSENIEGLTLGRKVARHAWKFYIDHLEGKVD